MPTTPKAHDPLLSDAKFNPLKSARDDREGQPLPDAPSKAISNTVATPDDAQEAPERPVMPQDAAIPRQRRRRLSKVRGRDGVVFVDLRVAGRISEKRWLARVWDPRLRKYRSKVHWELEQAEAWAEQEQARFSLKLSGAGQCTLASLVEPYGLELERRGRSPKHRDDVETILREAAADGVGDLKGDDLKDSVRRWLAGKGALSATTRNKYLTVVHSAVRFALGEGALSIDPLAGLRGETEAAKGKLREVFSPDGAAGGARGRQAQGR